MLSPYSMSRQTTGHSYNMAKEFEKIELIDSKAASGFDSARFYLVANASLINTNKAEAHQPGSQLISCNFEPPIPSSPRKSKCPSSWHAILFPKRSVVPVKSAYCTTQQRGKPAYRIRRWRSEDIRALHVILVKERQFVPFECVCCVCLSPTRGLRHGFGIVSYTRQKEELGRDGVGDDKGGAPCLVW